MVESDQKEPESDAKMDTVDELTKSKSPSLDSLLFKRRKKEKAIDTKKNQNQTNLHTRPRPII